VTTVYAKCSTCRARVWRDGGAADHVEDLCPGCAGPLEPVAQLSELVGLRCLRGRPRTAHRRPAEASSSVADQIRAVIARNDAERERRLDR
jgi:hypothetical protein